MFLLLGSGILFIGVGRGEVDAAVDDADHHSQHQITGQAFDADNNTSDGRMRDNLTVTDGCHGNNAKIDCIDNGNQSMTKVESRFKVEIVMDGIGAQVYDCECNDQVNEKGGKFPQIVWCGHCVGF